MGGQNLMLKDFYDILHGLDLTVVPDEDAVKLALYYVLERFFISRDRRRFISLPWLNIIDELEQFNLYPWGAVSYGYTIEAMQNAMKGRLESFKRRTAKDPSHRTERYNLQGCPYAVQVIFLPFFLMRVLLIFFFRFIYLFIIIFLVIYIFNYLLIGVVVRGGALYGPIIWSDCSWICSHYSADPEVDELQSPH
jgi:hypothetical protein